MHEIKAKLQNMIGPDCMLEVGKVTGAAVKEACSRMKPGKADVTGSFTSDILLNGPDSLFDSLFDCLSCLSCAWGCHTGAALMCLPAIVKRTPDESTCQ